MNTTALKGDWIHSSSLGRWNLLEKLLFRFFFCYFLLYILPFPLNRFPLGFSLDQLFFEFWKWLVPFVAEDVLGITYELTLPGGSGDTTFSYVQVFCQLGLALLLSFLWGVFDRKRRSYRRFFKLLLIILRYYLGIMLLSYGISKIFVNQFAEISLFDLIKPYGTSSPMGLMWNFMEYSSTYSIFSGFAEFLGGMLLFFRRTAKLGALVAFAVMLNVFLLNMSYDIPVKLFSFHLIFMAVFILIPHFKALFNFFIMNKPTVPEVNSKYFPSGKWNIAGYVVKGVFILHALIVFTSNKISVRERYDDPAALPELYGIYEVQDYIINKDTLAPLTTDPLRWDKLVIDRYNGGVVKMNDEILYLGYEIDTVQSQLTLTPYDSSEGMKMAYLQEDSRLVLEGNFNSKDIKINLVRKDREDFPLLNRGFHWINEYPNNR